MNDKMVDLITYTLAFVLALCILWALGLLPTLVDGILYPFFN